jgi:hypothetical protein
MFKTAFAAGLFAIGLFAALGLPNGPATAGPAQERTRVAPASDLSAQAQRPPARLRVYPRRQLNSRDYRDCEFKLVQQYRPSGTVIVPWQRCWWVRG